MDPSRRQSLLSQATLHAHGLDDPPAPEDLARLMSRTLSSRCLVYFTHGALVVRKENRAGEMTVLFDTGRGACIREVCQWFVREIGEQGRTHPNILCHSHTHIHFMGQITKTAHRFSESVVLM